MVPICAMFLLFQLITRRFKLAMPTDTATPMLMPRRMAVWEIEPMETSSTCLLTGISILWFLIPGYAISLALTFFVPQLFTRSGYG